MSEAKFTPGPWRVIEKRRKFKRIDTYDWDWKIVGSDGAMVFDCSHVAYEGGGYPPESANLALILAAPDLLAACEAALEALHGVEGFAEIRQTLRAAIAKAEPKIGLDSGA